VRLAVLFGSVAVGRESAGSDVDLLVALRGALAVATLAQRLSDRLGREVQLVRLEEAERSPILMVRRPRSRAGSWSTATRRGPG
jgi:predicted nucleotidyltransferase